MKYKTENLIWLIVSFNISCKLEISFGIFSAREVRTFSQWILGKGQIYYVAKVEQITPQKQLESWCITLGPLCAPVTREPIWRGLVNHQCSKVKRGHTHAHKVGLTKFWLVKISHKAWPQQNLIGSRSWPPCQRKLVPLWRGRIMQGGVQRSWGRSFDKCGIRGTYGGRGG